MPEFTDANVNIVRNLSFNQNYFRNAVRKTNVKSRVIFNQISRERSDLTPEDLGKFARRITIQDNQGKSPQDRFYDTFV